MRSDFFDNAPIGFHCLGPDGIILQANRADWEMLGYSEAEYVGHPVLDFHIEPDRMAEKLRALARGESLSGFEASLHCKDGSIRHVLIDASPSMCEGSLVYIRVVTREFGGYEDAAEQLRRYQANLEELLEERTREYQQFKAELESFSYAVAHDLRAPLRAIQGFSDALMEDYGPQLDPAGREYAERIAAGARRMERLIQDILSYTQISHREVHLASIRLEPAVKDAWLEITSQGDASDSDLLIPCALPAVLTNHGLLVKALTQLLSNAVKFVAPGTRACVRVYAEPADEMVRLWIEDNGIGIAPEFHRRIFGVFERLHGIEQYPGTGIGLAIARRAVERIGGRMGVESSVNAGSKFWMELPRIEESHV
jgi:PAS domain S-box-containing protein